MYLAVAYFSIAAEIFKILLGFGFFFHSIICLDVYNITSCYNFQTSSSLSRGVITDILLYFLGGCPRHSPARWRMAGLTHALHGAQRLLARATRPCVYVAACFSARAAGWCRSRFTHRVADLCADGAGGYYCVRRPFQPWLRCGRQCGCPVTLSGASGVKRPAPTAAERLCVELATLKQFF
jgi:hypothetical protein